MLGKNNKKNSVDDVTVAKVNQDLIVHNMPVGSFSSPKPDAAQKLNSKSQFLNSSSDKKNNFKMVGGVIVGLGIVFVGTLVYLSYIFIIKPKTEIPVAPSVETAVVNIEPVKEAEVPVIIATSTTPTTTDLTEIDPNIIDSENDLTASSTELEIIPEEEVVPPPLDTDLDSLTDDEELILGTNLALTDSDKDGYPDNEEIANGYSPVSMNKKLYPNEATTKYDDKVGEYSLYYPKDWSLRPLNNGYTIIISTPDNSLIQVSVSDNPNIQNISTWYAATFPGETNISDRLKNKESWEGIMSLDNLNFYLTGKNRENIYVVSYIPSISGRVAYPAIFKMIVDSLVLN